MKINVVDVHWSDEEMELIREAFKAQVTKLGELLRDAERSNIDTDTMEKLKHKHSKYKHFYEVFGGEDPI